MTDNESAVIDYFTSRAGTFVDEPGENDVLLKKQVGHHKGNQRLLEDTEEFRERYKSATSLSEKKEVAHQLLTRLKDRSGLFLKFNPIANNTTNNNNNSNNTNNNSTEEGRWCVQNYEESSLRVRQILRETTMGKSKLNGPTGHHKSTMTAAVTGGTSMLTPRIPRSNHHHTHHHLHHSLEYLEACKVLSDDTMNQACDLLLNTSHDSTDAKEQLLQLYQKCVQAANVIETELNNNPNPTAVFPLPPTLRGRTGSLGITTTATSNPIISKTKTVIPAVNRTRMMHHPSDLPHRGSMGHGPSSNYTTSHGGGGGGGGGGVKGLPPVKKMRRAPSPPPAAAATAALSSSSSSSSAVPESALQFLAKLNKEQDNHNDSNGTEEKTKEKIHKKDTEGGSQSSKNSVDTEDEPPKDLKHERSVPPVRVQPRRSSRAT